MSHYLFDIFNFQHVYERRFWRDGQEPKCIYASLIPDLIAEFEVTAPIGFSERLGVGFNILSRKP
jgi:hypothetical protein